MYIDLKNLLEEKQLSMYWLSKSTNIAYPTLDNLSKNKTTSIKFDTIEKICKALNCDVNELLKIEK